MKINTLINQLWFWVLSLSNWQSSHHEHLTSPHSKIQDSSIEHHSRCLCLLSWLFVPTFVFIFVFFFGFVLISIGIPMALRCNLKPCCISGEAKKSPQKGQKRHNGKTMSDKQNNGLQQSDNRSQQRDGATWWEDKATSSGWLGLNLWLEGF